MYREQSIGEEMPHLFQTRRNGLHEFLFVADFVDEGISVQVDEQTSCEQKSDQQCNGRKSQRTSHIDLINLAVLLGQDTMGPNGNIMVNAQGIANERNSRRLGNRRRHLSHLTQREMEYGMWYPPSPYIPPPRSLAQALGLHHNRPLALCKYAGHESESKSESAISEKSSPSVPHDPADPRSNSQPGHDADHPPRLS